MSGTFQGVRSLKPLFPEAEISHPKILLDNIIIICPVLSSGIYKISIQGMTIKIKGFLKVKEFLEITEFF